MKVRWFPRLVLASAVVLSALVGFTPVDAAQPADPPAPSAPAGQFVPNEALVQWKAGASDADKTSARGRVGAARREVVAPPRVTNRGELELVLLPPGRAVADAVRGLQGHPAVEFAEPNWIYHHQAIFTDSYLHQWLALGHVRRRHQPREPVWQPGQ